VGFTRIMFDEKSQDSSKKLLNWQFILFIILVVVGLSAIVFGLHTLISLSNESYPLEEAAPIASNSALLTTIQGFIYVDLAGAVKNPGIYQLAVGSRLATVISKSGGFTSQADAESISRELNLAQRLKDGDKIYISSQEEKEYQQSAAEFCQGLGGDPSQVSGESLTLISINNATASEIQTLEGIGEKRVEEILAGRPYQSLSELVEKEILTESLFGKIQNQLKL
jgi:competence protein ComEA